MIPHAGDGLYIADISQDECFVEYTGERYDPTTRVDDVDERYAFQVNKHLTIDAAQNNAKGLIRCVGIENNTDWYVKKKSGRVFLVATRPIPVPESLFREAVMTNRKLENVVHCRVRCWNYKELLNVKLDLLLFLVLYPVRSQDDAMISWNGHTHKQVP